MERRVRRIAGTRECVAAGPAVDRLDKGVGTGSGACTDRFARFDLAPVRGKFVKVPVIEECLASIACEVIDIARKHDIVVLGGLAARLGSARRE